MPCPRRGIAPFVVLILAACGSGRSILEAGNDPRPEQIGSSTTTTLGEPPAAGSLPTGTGVVPVPPTMPSTAPPTVPPTTAAPLDAYPPCPTDALDRATGPVEIVYWHGMNATTEQALVDLVAAYHASQDRVVVRLENQGGYLEAIDKYYQAGASARPDLIMFPEYGFQQAVDSGTFVPVGACLAASGFDTSAILPSTLRAYAQAGVQWGMPFNVSNPLLYYNKAMFAAAGLDPDRPPADFDELRQVSQQLVDSGVAAAGLSYDTNVDGGGGWYLEQWFATAGEMFVNHLNGRAQPATEVLFDGPTGQFLFSTLKALEADGLLVNVGDNAGGTDTLLKLADQQAPAAMAIASSATLGTVIEVLGSGLIPGLTPDDVGVGPLPSLSGTPSALVGGAANYVVAGNSDEVTAAVWDFITYLVTPEAQSMWAEATGYLPITAGATEIEPLASVYASDPRYRVAYDQLVNSPNDAAHAGAVIGPHRQVRAVLAGALAAVFDGADVASTLADAAAQADVLLQQYALLNQ